jgi:hypothetical protein
MIVGIIVIAVFAIFFLYIFWQISKDVSDTLKNIRHGKGILLTFNYTPEEWEYYTQNLPLTGQTGKVCFARDHIYITDGIEELLYEIFRLRKISVEAGFVIFTVRSKEFGLTESGKFIPDNPDNLKEYHILIPDAQQQQTDELIDFYQKVIEKYDMFQQKLLNQQAKSR